MIIMYEQIQRLGTVRVPLKNQKHQGVSLHIFSVGIGVLDTAESVETLSESKDPHDTKYHIKVKCLLLPLVELYIFFCTLPHIIFLHSFLHWTSGILSAKAIATATARGRLRISLFLIRVKKLWELEQ